MTKAEIQLVRALADKRGRTEHGLFVAEGAKLVGELRASHLRVRKIFALEGLFDETGAPPETARPARADRAEHSAGTAHPSGTQRSTHSAGTAYPSGTQRPAHAVRAGGAPEPPQVECLTPRDMERLSLLKTPSDALALVEIPHFRLDADRFGERLALALDDVQNPGNLGTIIRLADWFGIGEIVCSPATADCFNPKVVQATMGAILRVRIHYADLAPLLAGAAGRGVPVYGTFLEGENLYDTELTPAGIVVMGNEGRGLTAATARTVTRKLFIPPYPADRCGSESLNVAIATGIVCAEFRRRSAGHGS